MSLSKNAHWSSWLGPCASFLCLVHCVGLGILAIAAPGIASLLPHTEWLDPLVFATVFVSGSLSLRHLLASRSYWIVLWILSAITLTALILERHGFAHVTTLLMACVQIPLLGRHFRIKPAEHPACCEQEH